ncbi:MAG: T9SS type A sorting domain-containing protein [Crocinitomix sp.]|nr:T9SS type A sorting domain-containing protein [Crocinitomix sp.]
MNRFLITLTLISLIATGYAQKTYVPDDNFEQELIDLALDDVLDDSVLTVNIETVIGLSLNDLDISDLTGIEGFTELKSLFCYMNNLTTLDLSANLELRFLNFNGNDINEIDLSANVLMRELNCSGNEMLEMDLTNLLDLREFGGYGNEFVAIDFSNCTELESVGVGANLFTHLDFSNNPNLIYMNCADNNALVYLSVKNGANMDLETYNSTFCPRLNCIEVDDPTYSLANWLDKDPMANFNLNCGLSIAGINTVEVTFYPNPATEILNVEISDKQMDFDLIDISGKLIVAGSLAKGVNPINVSKLPAGVYFLKLKNDHYNTAHKTIIK